MPSNPTHLGLLEYSGASSAAVFGLQEMFEFTARLNARDSLAALKLSIIRPPLLPDTKFDAVILPPAFGNRQYLDPPADLIQWLRMQAESRCIMASACAGAFYLGAAGLLDQRRATTHWHLGQDLQRRFPNAMIDIDEIIINQANLITAGGMVAWIDLALELIDRFCGTAIMREVGRYFVIDTGRRAQSYYRDFYPNLEHGDSRIKHAQLLLERTFTSPIRISEIAKTVALSERTFLRRFQTATSYTPLAYVQHLRMQSAKRHLENTRAAIEQIAYNVGYENTNAFRKVFKRYTGLSPSQYRQRLKR
ncbi:MAG: AraC family transcriptional regulator [Rhodobacterales bacterium]|nr:MAG: AraC family transcriptional regulator [Rhodobacterales bacterium]